jgi:hypothetical protein
VRVDEELRAVFAHRPEKVRLPLRPGSVDDHPGKVERGGEQIRRPDAAVDRLVVLFADAGDEAVSEVEVHWIVSLGALDV